MNAAEATLKASITEGPTGLWLLAVFLLGLAAMAWLTVRETSAYETRVAIRNLRKRRRRKFPRSEELPLYSRANLFLRSVIRGGDIVDCMQGVNVQDQEAYRARLRREIDKLVGKDVYHGQKEQLKPPTRPATE